MRDAVNIYYIQRERVIVFFVACLDLRKVKPNDKNLVCTVKSGRELQENVLSPLFALFFSHCPGRLGSESKIYRDVRLHD